MLLHLKVHAPIYGRLCKFVPHNNWIMFNLQSR